MQKKIIFIVLVTLLIVLCACQPTPADEIIVGKSGEELKNILNSTGEPVLLEDISPSSQEQEGEHLHIEQTEERIEIVGNWNQEWVTGNSSVIVDANVTRPNTDTITVLEVAKKDFNDQDVAKVVELFIGDNAYSNTNFFTKEAIETQILESEKILSELRRQNTPSDDSRPLEVQIEEVETRISELQKQYNSAPDNVVQETEGSLNFIKEFAGEAVMLHFIDDNNKERSLIVRNFSEENATSITYRYFDFNLISYSPIKESEVVTVTEDLPDISDVQIFLQPYFVALGIEGCTLQHHEALLATKEASDIGAVYILHYTRNYGNGQITNPQSRTTSLFSGETSHEEYALAHEAEEITVITDGTTILSFSWNNPHEVAQTVNENAPLIDVEDIKTICQTQLDRLIKGESLTSNFNITDLHMSNMYIRVQDSDTYYVLPVWDLIGYEIENDENLVNQEHPFENRQMSIVTVNAIDGSIINRELNY